MLLHSGRAPCRHGYLLRQTRSPTRLHRSPPCLLPLSLRLNLEVRLDLLVQ